MNLLNPEEGMDETLQGNYDRGSQEAIGMVVAVCMALLVVLATSIALLYIWKGDDGFIIAGPSSALVSWEWEYREMVGANNDSVVSLDGSGVVVCLSLIHI